MPGVGFQAGKEVCPLTWVAKQMRRRLKRQRHGHRGTVEVEDSCLGRLLTCEQFSGVNKFGTREEPQAAESMKERKRWSEERLEQRGPPKILLLYLLGFMQYMSFHSALF